MNQFSPYSDKSPEQLLLDTALIESNSEQVDALENLQKKSLRARIGIQETWFEDFEELDSYFEMVEEYAEALARIEDGLIPVPDMPQLADLGTYLPEFMLSMNQDVFANLLTLTQMRIDHVRRAMVGKSNRAILSSINTNIWRVAEKLDYCHIEAFLPSLQEFQSIKESLANIEGDMDYLHTDSMTANMHLNNLVTAQRNTNVTLASNGNTLQVGLANIQATIGGQGQIDLSQIIAALEVINDTLQEVGKDEEGLSTARILAAIKTRLPQNLTINLSTTSADEKFSWGYTA